MAAGTTYSDREFHFRLQTLVIDGGTEVLRNILDLRLQIQPLNVALAKEQSTLNRLRRQNTLTRAQYDVLFPSSGPSPTSSDLDITLIVCLLRNLPCLGLNQNYNWNVPPQAGDTSIEADVSRLRAFRNEIAHISSTSGFQQSSFQLKWSEIETVLLRLDQNSPTQNFSQTIDSYKYSPMDPANEQRITTMIEQWQEKDRGLETDMQLIKKDVSDTKDDVSSIKKDVSDTKDNVTSIRDDICDTKNDVTSIRNDVSGMKDDVTNIKKDVYDTKDDVTSIRKDVSDTKDDVTSIKKDLGNTKDDLTSIRKDVSDTKDDVTSIKKDVSDTKDDVKSISKDVSDTKDDVTSIKKGVSDTKDDVTSIRKDASDTKDDVTSIRKDVCDTKDDVTNIKKDIIDTKNDVTIIKKDVSGTKADVRSIRKDVTDTKDDIKDLKKDVSDLKNEFSDSGRRRKSGIPRRIHKFSGSLKKDLQDDLISFYKLKHMGIPLSPLLDEDQPLLKFYEMPDIQSVKVTRSQDGDRIDKTPIKTLRDVFYKANKLCRNIYLMADAGYGKTTFSKKLALAWCHAKKPDKSEKKHFSRDEITAMGGFSFVFVVPLRDSSSECDIDRLIFNQILSQLKNDYSFQNLRQILCKETCLVILDGLDEWTHPLNSCRQGESNIPHQRVRDNVAVLTTTRPWKLSVSSLHSSQIDKKLELEGLSNASAKKLKRSVISHMHGEENKRKIDTYENEFNMSVKESHKSDLIAIPLFLMYFLFLWYYKLNVGKTLADLYSSFIELLLSRTVSKEGIRIPKTDTVQGNIPPCFNEKERCKQFYTLLTTLGKLAFYTLFSEKKENTLVFDGCVAEKYLSKEELTFCLKTGIITQSKVQGNASLLKKTKVSFAHKTMQEFLAALYINSVTDQSSVQETIFSKCTCVKDILDMSKIFVFIASISARFSFSHELIKIINDDEITQEYRRSLQDGGYDHPLKDFQDMYISCCKDIPRENEINLCLQDVIIEESCKQEEYRENLKRLTTRNKQNIRTVYIEMLDMDETPYNTARKVIDYFSLSDLENIKKIQYMGEYSDDVILPLLNSSVESLYLSCSILQPGSWSHSLFDKLSSLHQLEAIGISGFDTSQGELRLLLNFISQRDCLREIDLGYLSLPDHEGSPSTGLDLTRLSSLRKLTLSGLELTQVIINMASLEKCGLWYLSNRDLVLKFINFADNKLDTFKCSGLNSSPAIDEIVHTLQDARYIRDVGLYEVTMEASALAELVDSVLKLQQTVTVEIVGCTISPRKEFKTLKGKVKTSQRVVILEDRDDRFTFDTN